MKQLIIDIDCDLLNRIREAKSVPDMCGADIVNAINAIKSGIPTYERPIGEWIYIGQSQKGLKVVECTNCHKRQYGSLNYCGNCGADMRKLQTQKFADNDTAYGGLASAT